MASWATAYHRREANQNQVDEVLASHGALAPLHPDAPCRPVHPGLHPCVQSLEMPGPWDRQGLASRTPLPGAFGYQGGHAALTKDYRGH
jgi:hypothetical protein